MNNLKEILTFNKLFLLIGHVFKLITILLLIIMPMIHILNVIPFYFNYYPFPIAILFVLLSFYFILYINMMYYRCITIKRYPTYNITHLHDFYQGELEQSPFTLCSKCQKLRPFRCHHCRFCEECIYRMDHHCSWIGNCVGDHNIRYFLLFIFSLSLSCLLGAVTQIPYERTTKITKALYTLECVLGITLLIYGGSHFYLMITNQTTLEFAGNLTFYFSQPKQIRKWITPYDWGWKKNVEMVLKYENVWELLNPFALQKDCDFMKVDVVDEFVDHADFVDEFVLKNEINETKNVDN